MDEVERSRASIGSAVVGEPARLAALVLGIGNELRGDDAFGPIVADCCAEQLISAASDGQVRVEVRASITPELAIDLAGAERLVLVDARLSGDDGVTITPLDRFGEAEPPCVHFLDPRALLQWTAMMYGRQPETFLVSVRGRSFECGLRVLSPEVQALVPVASAAVMELISRTRVSGVRHCALPDHVP